MTKAHPESRVSTLTPSPATNTEMKDCSAAMKDGKGRDGKLRVERHAVLANPEALEDQDHSDENGPPPETIEADEGTLLPALSIYPGTSPYFHVASSTSLLQFCIPQGLMYMSLLSL